MNVSSETYSKRRDHLNNYAYISDHNPIHNFCLIFNMCLVFRIGWWWSKIVDETFTYLNKEYNFNFLQLVTKTWASLLIEFLFLTSISKY